MIRSKRTIYSNLLVLLIFLTNISQIPFIVELGISSKIVSLIWLVFFISLVANKKIFLNNEVFIPLICIFSFLIFIFWGEFIYGYNYIKSAMTHSFFISIFIFFNGFFLSKIISPEEFDKIAWAYIIGGGIVTFFVWLNIKDISNILESRVYAYNAKNSVSQIILTTIILLFMVENKKKNISISQYILTIPCFILLILLKSRATIIFIPLLIFILLTHSQVDKKKKIVILMFILILFIILKFNQPLVDNIVNNVILGGRESDNLDDISSGRFSMWLEFPTIFNQSPLVGRGYFYTESFPLAVLINYGLIGSIPIFTFTLMPLCWSIFKKNKQRIILVVLFLSSSYWLNGLFEELSPLGPGVKCYFLWLVFGLSIGWKKVVIPRNSEINSKNIQL